jgi:anti-anti-sigma factor
LFEILAKAETRRKKRGNNVELELSHEEGYVLAATAGRIDDSTDELFKERLHPLVCQRGTKVILDLSQSKLITSRGIGSLVSLVVHANASGSRVVLAACTPFVATVLETSKLNKFFDITASTSEALSLFSG